MLLQDIVRQLTTLDAEVTFLRPDGIFSGDMSLKGTLRIDFKVGKSQESIYYRVPYPLPNGAVLLDGTFRVTSLFFVPQKTEIKRLDLQFVDVWAIECWRVKKIAERYGKLLKNKSEDVKELLFELECALNAWNPNNFVAFPFLDRTNPLSEEAALRKVTHQNENAYTERRYNHQSQFGRLCALETPESKDIGLTRFLAHGSVLNNGKIIPAAAKNTGGDANFLGLSCLQVPFIQHNDGARAMMGGKNLKQALPLINGQPPLVQTGRERTVAALSGRLVKARSAGTITRVSQVGAGGVVEIVLQPAAKNKPVESYTVSGAKNVFGTFEGTAYWETPVVAEGDKVKKGQVIAYGAGTDGQVLAMGRNLVIAYVPWFGYTFEDGIVANQKLVAQNTLDTRHVYAYKVDLAEKDTLKKSVAEGDSVCYGDNLVEIARYKGKKENFTEVLQYKRRSSGRVLRKELTVTPDGSQKLRFEIEEIRSLETGDKLTGRHGNKGVVSLLLSPEQMPYFKDSDGNKVEIDLFLNPLGIVSRMNLGQLLETSYAWVRKQKPSAVPENIGQPFDPDKQINLKKLPELLTATGLDGEGKAVLFRINEGKEEELGRFTVGVQYFVKLCHLSRDKMHVRGFEGGYSSITGQALRGKKLQGGQRIGEMEVWALIAHQCFSLLNELTTGLSDERRSKAVLKNISLNTDISHNGDVERNLREWVSLWVAKNKPKLGNGIGASFLAFRNYLRAAGLELDLIGKQGKTLKASVSPEDVAQIRIRPLNDKDIKTISAGQLVSGQKGKKVDPLCDTVVFGATHEQHSKLFGHIELPEPVLNPFFAKDKIVSVVISHLRQLVSARNMEIVTHFENLALLYSKLKGETGQAHKELLEEIEVIRTGDKSDTPRLNALREEADRTRRVPINKYRAGDGSEYVEIVHMKVGAALYNKAFREAVLLRDLSATYINKKWQFYDATTIDEAPSGAAIYSGSALLLKFAAVVMPRECEALEQLFLNYLPVLPLVYRQPSEDLSSPLQQLYRNVLYKCNNLRTALSTAEQSSIMWARADLYKALKSLILSSENLSRNIPAGFSIMERLAQKEGFIRANLLGKRCDMSGRAVIVPDPALPIDEFGLPLDIAIGFITDLLPASYPNAHLFKEALKGNTEAREKLAEYLQKVFEQNKTRFILNRQPSLHKFSILAFKPRIRLDYCLGLPPLVCGGFNADFDGDTMAVYLPLSAEAQADAARMSPQNHLFSYSNGELLLSFSKDFAAGAYFGLQRDPQLFSALLPGADKGFNFAIADFCKEHHSEPGFAAALLKIQNVCLKEALVAGISPGFFDAVELSSGKDWNILKKEITAKASNPFTRMFVSGAGGKQEQLEQLFGLKGKVMDEAGVPTGVVISSNYTEGLSPDYYFAATSGTRMAMLDKKLGVGKAGAFARQMVEGGYDTLVTVADCGNSDNGLAINLNKIRAMNVARDTAQKTPIHFKKWLPGRILAADVTEGHLALPAGKVLTAADSELLENTLAVNQICIRSPLSCSAANGICSKCCGLPVGATAGVIAGQTIGEKSTQASMRTFHTGQKSLDLRVLVSALVRGKIIEEKNEDDKTNEGEKGQYKEILDLHTLRSAVAAYDEILPVFWDIYKDSVNPVYLEILLRGMCGKHFMSLHELSQDWRRRGLLAAASFEDSARVLRQAAAARHEDSLRSMKSKVIIGRKYVP